MEWGLFPIKESQLRMDMVKRLEPVVYLWVSLRLGNNIASTKVSTNMAASNMGNHIEGVTVQSQEDAVTLI